jgi:muconate cycloisomerase
MAWRTAKKAMAMIDRLAPYQLQFVEQPLPPKDLDGMAFLRREAAIPIMADEGVWTLWDCMEVIKREAADYVNVYVSKAGGLLNASRIFAMCESAGVSCMIGSMPEFGIGTAAAIHLGVAMSDLTLNSDTCGVLYHTEDLLSVPLRISEGLAYPPSGPGLGVEVDMEVVARWQMKQSDDA